MTTEELQKSYFELGNELSKIYSDLNFENHCYWRMALDNTVKDKWSNKVDKPAYKNLTEKQLKQVIDWLQAYKSDRSLVHAHNQQSLQYRKAEKRTR